MFDALEFREHLPALENLFRERKEQRKQHDLPIRVAIAAQAIVAFYQTLPQSQEGIVQDVLRFLETTPYTQWRSKSIAFWIECDRKGPDTPEDRQKLHDTITLMLTKDVPLALDVVSYAVKSMLPRVPPRQRRCQDG